MKIKITIVMTMIITITMTIVITTIIIITMEQTSTMKVNILIGILTKLITIFIVSTRRAIVVNFPNSLLTCGWIKYAH